MIKFDLDSTTTNKIIVVIGTPSSGTSWTREMFKNTIKNQEEFKQMYMQMPWIDKRRDDNENI